MRRGSKAKIGKSEVFNENKNHNTNYIHIETEETRSVASNLISKKRNKEDSDFQENGKFIIKKRKNENIDNSIESNEEIENILTEDLQSIKKKKERQEEKNKPELNDKTVKNKKKRIIIEKVDLDEEELDKEYEVERIVDQRTIKGRRQFLVRWKGYSADHDTWEQEKELNCDRLIGEFLIEREENKEDNRKKQKIEKKVKGNKQDKKVAKQKQTNVSKDEKLQKEISENDDKIEYEVEKIIEVKFKKDKSREFLIRWKGFSKKDDSWEPEKYLNCPELIEKFLEKLDKIKKTEARELRTNPVHTKRFSLTMYSDKRQSRRNAKKERVTYHECD